MKNTTLRAALLAATALITANTAFAQTALEEITVTAQRRETDLQTTPVTVTALTAADLERLQTSDVTDVAFTVPTLLIDKNVGSGNALGISLRGNAEINGGFLFSEPGVGLYWNGVYRRLSGGNMELGNIERIEVLRGPQGTLFGRNTLAGALNIVTKRPGDTLEGEASISYGSFDTVVGKARVSGPVSDQLSLGISGLVREQGEGQFNNRVTGTDVGQTDFAGGNFDAHWTPSDTVTVDLSLYASNNQTDGQQTFPVSAATNQRIYASAKDVATAPVRVGTTTIAPFTETDQMGADLTIEVDAGDGLTLKSISSYINMDDGWAVDFTSAQAGAPAPTAGTSGFFRTSDGEQDQYSQELQLLGDTDRFDWVLGAFYYKENTDQDIQDYFAGGLFPAAPSTNDLKSRSFALFGQGTYAITDQLSITGGLRQTWDKKRFRGAKANAASVLQAFDVPDKVDRLTAKVGVEYTVSDDVFTYASFSQGFKSGQYDPFAPSPTIGTALDPEKVDAFEVGAKIEGFDDRVRLNLAAFHNRYKDLAVGAITPAGLLLDNVGTNRVIGLEGELTWLATDTLTLYATGSIQDGKWTRLDNQNPVTGARLTDELSVLPKYKASVGFAQAIPLASGEITLGSDISYNSGYYVQVAHRNNPLDRVDSRFLLNASISYAIDNHTLTLAGKNLTQEHDTYSVLNFSTFLFNNTVARFPVDRRSFNLTYKYSY
jgi:iron complex outermembrane receptor protein